MCKWCNENIFYVDRYRIYDLYWELESICDEIQNLADYGWFLEILGEMADSKNIWWEWVTEMVLT